MTIYSTFFKHCYCVASSPWFLWRKTTLEWFDLIFFLFSFSLHTQQPRGKNVAEIAYKFSFADHQQSVSSPVHVQREDALSAASAVRFAQANQHTQHVEDGLVQRTRLGSSPGPPPVSQVFVPPPPPPPPAFVPPPPPPPPPVLPPPQGVVLRRPTKKGDKKKRDSGPQLSMAEVVAKARKMREARERVLSSGSSTSATQESSEDPFESAIQARVVQLKTRRVEVQQGSRPEEDSELVREMRRKAQRASRAFVETHVSIEDGNLPVENERKVSRAFSSSSSSKDTGDNDSLQSLENTEKLESPKEVNDFVDSLFDPVLSQGVEGLSNEVALQGALKGGGGVNQPNSTAANSSAAGTFTTTAAMNGHPTGQGNGYPVAPGQGNGYPVSPGQGNGYPVAPGQGYPGLVQGNVFPGMIPGGMFYGLPQTNGPLFPATNMDAAMLAAQQQILIERLIAQQAMLQQQQTVASQKQQEQLLMLAQQQQTQLEQMQQILAASSQQPLSPLSLNQAGASASVQASDFAQSSTSAASSVPVNGHVAVANGDAAIRVPSPPPEFSDINHSERRSSQVPVPPRTSSLLPPPPPFPNGQEQTIAATEAFPPPPSPIAESTIESTIVIDSVDAPQRPELKRRSTDKVALAVAALELKSDDVRSPGPTSPLKRGENFTFETPAKEKPGFHKRTSSSVGFVLLSDKQNNTVLHPRCTEPYLSYNNVKWKFNIRKEVRPSSPND